MELFTEADHLAEARYRKLLREQPGFVWRRFSDGEELMAYVFFPPGHRAEAAAPSVLFFHGGIFSAPEKMAAAAIGFAAFSLSASAIYALNDCRDAPQDRQHPRKKNRPVAAGRISEKAALTMALALAALSAGILLAGRGMIAQFGAAAATLTAYLLMNVCYTVFGLKHVPILDVSIVALGFVMRILFGSFLTGIPVSSWLLLTVMVASYYMSFGKRRNELRALGQNSVRRVLSLYTPEFLTQSTNMFLTLTIVFYALWSVDVQTELRYAQGRAVWSLPLVILILLFYHYDIDTGRMATRWRSSCMTGGWWCWPASMWR